MIVQIQIMPSIIDHKKTVHVFEKVIRSVVEKIIFLHIMLYQFLKQNLEHLEESCKLQSKCC